MPNRLSKETSPYLLQHANNPVDWYPWGEEALQKARLEDKPILVSIGYSACHWCHVMERESFENPETAALMNRLFVNIKIDREERPDLDQIYMDAVQAIAGNGGWPLNVFLTPDGKPFYGGTYFPPREFHNRASWSSVLQQIARSFKEKREEVDQQADNLTQHIAGSGFRIELPAGNLTFKKEDIGEIFNNLMKTADQKDGGFGGAPKFPQTFSIRLLLQYYYYMKESSALEHACLSLDKMIFGGIYDQLRGGFARYSTDSEWLAPHFEKMLYDNALLVTAISEAYQFTKKVHYAKAIRETIEFIESELMSERGGFFSALDADSEGEEGKFYVWTKKEITEVLGADAEAFSDYYDVSQTGNWEGKNILRITVTSKHIDQKKLALWKKKLLARRSKRVRPQLDDKILLGWNALMITAYCKAFAALGDDSYRRKAVEIMQFLEDNMQGINRYRFYHCYNKENIPAFLDDYAWLIESYIQLQEITGDSTYLTRAKSLTEWVILHFKENNSDYFYYTHIDQDDLIVRKREIYDGATPSGNSVMAANLLYLGTVFDLEEWKEMAGRNTSGIRGMIKQYPGSFGVWATLLNGLTYPLYEIALVGESPEIKLPEFLAQPMPNRVFQFSSVALPDFPILGNKPDSGPSQFFLCRAYSCQQPVKEVAELVALIKNS